MVYTLELLSLCKHVVVNSPASPWEYGEDIGTMMNENKDRWGFE